MLMSESVRYILDRIKAPEGYIKPNKENVLRVIDFIKKEFQEAKLNPERIYMQGQCGNLHILLKNIFPSAETVSCNNSGHIMTKIGNGYYDINGYHELTNLKDDTSGKQLIKTVGKNRKKYFRHKLDSGLSKKELENALKESTSNYSDHFMNDNIVTVAMSKKLKNFAESKLQSRQDTL